MKINSKIIEIRNIGKPSTEYIEQELTNINIIPLRWAIVYVSDKIYKVSVENIEN